MIKTVLNHLILDQAINLLFDPLIDSFKSDQQSKDDIDEIIDNCIHTGFMPAKVYAHQFVFMNIRIFDDSYGKHFIHLESDNHTFCGNHKGYAVFKIARHNINKILI